MPTSRRLAIAATSFALVGAAVVPASFAASLPASAPAGFAQLEKDGSAARYTKRITSAMLGNAASQSWTYGGGMTHGGGSITLSKLRAKGETATRTITVTSLGAPIIVLGNVTLSGGTFGSALIRSTTAAKSGKTWTIVFEAPDEQGVPPTMTLQFYTYTAPEPIS